MKVLVVKISSMGDIIHALPALADARKHYPELSFDWVLEDVFAEIPTWHFAVDKVIPVAIRRWRKAPLAKKTISEWCNFKQAITKQSYDLIIDAQGLLKSSITALFAQGTRCGMDLSTIREPLASFLYHQKFHISKRQHAITRIRELFAKSLQYPIPQGSIDSGIIDTFSNINPDNYLIFLHGTTRQNKKWPVANWIELAKIAALHQQKIKVFWHGASEYQVVSTIAQECANIEILPTLNLTAIAKIIKGAKAVVAVDTGLAHLAAALNVPLVSLYGPTNPCLIGTYSDVAKHLYAPQQDLSKLTAAEVWQALKIDLQ